MSTKPLPLEGIRILDIATFIAAPFAATCLSEFGAEVIKIEKPGVGDYLRHLGTPSEAGDTYWWFNDSRNKKCVTLDLKTDKGADIFKRLVTDAHVVTENFRPGTLEKWGLGYEDLKAVNKALVMLRVSAYGQEGPKRNLPGFARIAQAYASLTSPASRIRRRLSQAPPRSRTICRGFTAPTASCSPCASRKKPAKASTSTSACTTASSGS
jgi:succinyl-CoA:(S)-malate CoA-transferase subunit B